MPLNRPKQVRGVLGISALLFSAVCAIFVLSLFAHLLYLFQPFFMDEMPILSNQMRFVYERTILPDHAKYPTFFYYLSLPATAAAVVFRFLFGEFASVGQAAAEMLLFDQRGLAMGARLLNIIVLYAAAAIVAQIVWRHFTPTAAVLIFLLLVAAPSFLQYSAYALPDTMLILLSAGALHFLYRVRTPDRFFDFYVAVALIGLAISTKYNAAGLLLPATIWGIATHWRAGALLTGAFFRRALIGIVVVLGFFLLGSPGWVIDPAFFRDELIFEMEHADRGHLGATGVPVLGEIELLLTNLPILFSLSVAGMYLTARRPSLDSLLPLSTVLGTLLLAAISEKQSFHYLFPAIPGLAIFAGGTIHGITRRFGNVGTGAIGIIVLFLCLVSSYMATSFLKLNTTDLAKAWIVAHVPEGTHVVRAWAYVPELYSEEAIAEISGRSIYRMIGADPLADEPRYIVSRYEYDFEELSASDAEYLVTSSQVFDRFLNFGVFTRIAPSPRDPLFDDFERRRQFYLRLFGSPDWRIVFEADTGNGPQTLVFQRRNRE